VSLGRYALIVTAVATTTLALVWLVALRRAELGVRAAVAFGAALAVLNTLAAHALVVWSTGRTTKAFLGAVLGGMVGRMAAMLAALLAGALLLELPILPLALSLLAYFVLFLILELAILHRHPGDAAATR
jgi:hypothetical protein